MNSRLDCSNVLSMAPHADSSPANSSADTPQKHVHVLIVGAGLTGLILAQGLRKFNASPAAATHQIQYTYTIYERDPYAFARGGGWSLTIHWALTDLRNILPDDILAGFHDCLVNPHAAEQGIAGNFQYLNLRTAEQVAAWPIPVGAASRVSREKIIALLMTGLDIRYSMQLVDITHPSNEVNAHFANGVCETGSLLIGCDGLRSSVRRALCRSNPEAALNNSVPVRLIGLKVLYPVQKVQKCLDIDVHFFQGGDPHTDVYFWFSFIHLPRPTDTEEYATCQIMLSWPFKKGFLGRDEPTEMPATQAERRAWMRRLAYGWAEPFRELVYYLPEDTEYREIVMEDWPPKQRSWDNRNGTVTLVGDAAHGMTMCEYKPPREVLI